MNINKYNDNFSIDDYTYCTALMVQRLKQGQFIHSVYVYSKPNLHRCYIDGCIETINSTYGHKTVSSFVSVNLGSYLLSLPPIIEYNGDTYFLHLLSVPINQSLVLKDVDIAFANNYLIRYYDEFSPIPYIGQSRSSSTHWLTCVIDSNVSEIRFNYTVKYLYIAYTDNKLLYSIDRITINNNEQEYTILYKYQHDDGCFYLLELSDPIRITTIKIEPKYADSFITVIY